MRMHSADPKTLTPEIFQLFKTQNALLTAGDREGCNTMTIGWCQLGTLWNLPVCTVYVRPERYTYQFMESKDYFTVSVLPASEKETLRICGTQSGRDTDKIKTCGLTVCYGAGDAPFIEESELVLVCKKLYVQDLAPECVKDERIFRSYGAMGGWRRGYTGEVLEAYIIK
ncbi:flavin reductase [Oscillibacter sp.]|uniref:flavin reductase family protein n=1 Tax=Oscillibacter sp. TaxID=1945593 RepID=UPI00262872C6|nr:flavin reductase [Oscillibacter sp.]MDD3346853.1 flavin reductase [Oscillibacter sp.]